MIHMNQTLSNDHGARHTLGPLLELLPLVMELPRPVVWHWFFSGSHFPSIGSQGKSSEPKSRSCLCQKAGELASVFHSPLLQVALTCPDTDECRGQSHRAITIWCGWLPNSLRT